jgi:tetratricopeptide (TPR) repeat protein
VNPESIEDLLALRASNPGDPGISYRCAKAHDRAGLERKAVPFYLEAIDNGLDGDDLRGAFLGLGSTYRAIGEYQQAVDTLDRGLERYPGAEELVMFRALARYNLGDPTTAMSDLLKILAAHTDSEWITRYRRAIEFYADRLDETW